MVEDGIYCFFLISFIIFALLFSLPPSRNSDPGSHSRLFSPLSTTVRGLKNAIPATLARGTHKKKSTPYLFFESQTGRV